MKLADSCRYKQGKALPVSSHTLVSFLLESLRQSLIANFQKGCIMNGKVALITKGIGSLQFLQGIEWSRLATFNLKLEAKKLLNLGAPSQKERELPLITSSCSSKGKTGTHLDIEFLEE